MYFWGFLHSKEHTSLGLNSNFRLQYNLQKWILMRPGDMNKYLLARYINFGDKNPIQNILTTCSSYEFVNNTHDSQHGHMALSCWE